MPGPAPSSGAAGTEELKPRARDHASFVAELNKFSSPEQRAERKQFEDLKLHGELGVLVNELKWVMNARGSYDVVVYTDERKSPGTPATHLEDIGQNTELLKIFKAAQPNLLFKAKVCEQIFHLLANQSTVKPHWANDETKKEWIETMVNRMRNMLRVIYLNDRKIKPPQWVQTLPWREGSDVPELTAAIPEQDGQESGVLLDRPKAAGSASRDLEEVDASRPTPPAEVEPKAVNRSRVDGRWIYKIDEKTNEVWQTHDGTPWGDHLSRPGDKRTGYTISWNKGLMIPFRLQTDESLIEQGFNPNKTKASQEPGELEPYKDDEQPLIGKWPSNDLVVELNITGAAASLLNRAGSANAKAVEILWKKNIQRQITTSTSSS